MSQDGMRNTFKVACALSPVVKVVNVKMSAGLSLIERIFLRINIYCERVQNASKDTQMQHTSPDLTISKTYRSQWAEFRKKI